MIVFITTRDHRYTFKQVLGPRFGRKWARVRSYDWLFRQRAITASAVVFTDFDRLRHYELAAAARLYRKLRDCGIKVFNDPALSRQRFDLLHQLHDAGINSFRAYKAVARPAPLRFPVFVKCETNHVQEFDELIADQDRLDRRLAEIEMSGVPLRDLLVIEFANTPEREGVYCRSTIYRIGDAMIAGNTVSEAKPFVKYGTAGLATDDELDAYAARMNANGDAGAMRRVFDIARIEFGRADYGHDENGIAVYEINTNPQIGNRVTTRHEMFRDATAESFRLVIAAIRALGGETRSADLSHGRRWFSGLRLAVGLRLKQP